MTKLEKGIHFSCQADRVAGAAGQPIDVLTRWQANELNLTNMRPEMYVNLETAGHLLRVAAWRVHLSGGASVVGQNP